MSETVQNISIVSFFYFCLNRLHFIGFSFHFFDLFFINTLSFIYVLFLSSSFTCLGRDVTALWFVTERVRVGVTLQINTRKREACLLFAFVLWLLLVMTLAFLNTRNVKLEIVIAMYFFYKLHLAIIWLRHCVLWVVKGLSSASDSTNSKRKREALSLLFSHYDHYWLSCRLPLK